MQTVDEIYTTENLQIRLVRVLPGEVGALQINHDQNVVSIPLSGLERGAPFEMFRAYMLNYTRPDEYYSLNPNGDKEENFIQFIWKARAR